MKSLLATGLLFFSANAFSAECTANGSNVPCRLSLKDNIITYATTKDDATARQTVACKTWSSHSETSTLLKKIYASCGSAEYKKDIRREEVWVPGTCFPEPDGRSTCGPGDYQTRDKVIGYQANAQATLVAEVSSAFYTIEETLAFSKLSETTQLCETFKANAKVAFGNKLIWATCNLFVETMHGTIYVAE